MNNNNESINVLLIDDSEDQLFLVEDELGQAGFIAYLLRVDNEKALMKALNQSRTWDIAILDYTMPGFTAERALSIVKQQEDIPVIVVSGTVGEEKVVRMMQAGARDYISKFQRHRFIPSVKRELADRKLRQNQRLSEIKLRETEHKLALIATAAQDGIFLLDSHQYIEFWNAAAERITGYCEKEALGKNFCQLLIPQNLHNTFQQHFDNLKLNQGLIEEQVILTKQKEKLIIELSLSSASLDSNWSAIGILRDVSERKRLEQELKMMAIKDPLTHLFNRRELVLRLAKEINRISRYHHSLSLFFIDVDHFKAINDQFGHYIGDIVLCRLADTLKTRVRNHDICGRYGGEEFLVVLPETPLAKALELAERLRQIISKIEINLDSGQKITITASIGVAEFDEHKHTLETFIRQADDAMYEAKQLGRNRVYSIDAIPKQI